MRKVCVVITARPSYSRVKSALSAIDRHEQLELQLVVAGSALLDKFGDAVRFIEKDGFNVTEKVFITVEGENLTSMAKSTGLAVMELANVLYNLDPDMVITIADRYETLATSIASSYQNIPLVHLQGGEVTGNIDEKVRHANSKLADIHLVATDLARRNLLRMGEDDEYIFETGCPSIDLARIVQDEDEQMFDPVERYGGVGAGFSLPEDYIVVMQHPVTNEYEKAKDHVSQTLNAIEQIGMPTYWFWPNVDAGSDGTSRGIRTFREKNAPGYLHLFKNMEPLDFLRLLKNSRCLVGNSSVGIRECSYLGVPVVNIGTRQFGRERAENVLDIDYSESEIVQAIGNQLDHGVFAINTLYGEGRSGEIIAEVLSEVKLRSHKTLSYGYESLD